MKSLPIMILTAYMMLAASCNNRYFPVSELRFNGMKGNVQSTKTSCFEASQRFGEVIKDEDEIVFVIRQKFDENGFMIENIHYNKYGKESYEGYFTYSDGYMSGFVEINTYGKQKKEIKGTRIELSKNYAKWEYEGTGFKYGELTYDDIIVNGDCYHQINTNEDGVVVMQRLIRKDGFIVTQIRHDNDGSMMFNEAYELNSDDLIVKSIRCNNHSVESYTEICEYEYTEFDDHGNWTKRIMKCNGSLYLQEREINYR